MTKPPTGLLFVTILIMEIASSSAKAHEIVVMSQILDDATTIYGVGTLVVDSSRTRLQIVVPLPVSPDRIVVSAHMRRHLTVLADVYALDLLAQSENSKAEITGLYLIDPSVGAALIEKPWLYYIEVRRVASSSTAPTRRRAISGTPVTFAGAIDYFKQSVCGFVDAAAAAYPGQLRDLFGNVRNPLSPGELATCHPPKPSDLVCTGGPGPIGGRAGQCTCDTLDECREVARFCSSGMSLPNGGGIGFDCDLNGLFP